MLGNKKRPIHALFEFLTQFDFSKFSKYQGEISTILAQYHETIQNYEWGEFFDGYSSASRGFDYSEVDSRSDTKTDLEKILTDMGSVVNTQNYSELMLYVLFLLIHNTDTFYDQSLSKQNSEQKDNRLNVYQNPEALLSHGFELLKYDRELKKELQILKEGALNTKTIAIVQDLNLFYKECYDILSIAIAPANIYFESNLLYNLFDSLDIFLAMSLTKRLIIYDEENTGKYFKTFQLFLEEFLRSYPKSRNINSYLKAKYKLLVEKKFEGTYITYFRDMNVKIQEILKKKENEIIVSLLELLRTSEDLNIKIEIILAISSKQNLFLDNDNNFRDETIETQFIDLLLDRSERVQDYVVGLLDETTKLSCSYLFKILNEADVRLREPITSILDKNEWSSDNEEDKIHDYLMRKEYYKLNIFQNNTAVLSKLLEKEYEKNDWKTRKELVKIFGNYPQEDMMNLLAKWSKERYTDHDNKFYQRYYFLEELIIAYGKIANDTALEDLLQMMPDDLDDTEDTFYSLDIHIFEALIPSAKGGSEKAIKEVIAYSKRKFESTISADRYRIYNSRFTEPRHITSRHVNLLLQIQDKRVEDMLYEYARKETQYQNTLLHQLSELKTQKTKDLMWFLYETVKDNNIIRIATQILGQIDAKKVIEISKKIIEKEEFFVNFHKEKLDVRTQIDELSKVYSHSAKDNMLLKRLGYFVEGLVESRTNESFEFLISLLLEENTRILWKMYITSPKYLGSDMILPEEKSNETILYLLKHYPDADAFTRSYLEKLILNCGEIEDDVYLDKIKSFLQNFPSELSGDFIGLLSEKIIEHTANEEITLEWLKRRLEHKNERIRSDTLSKLHELLDESKLEMNKVAQLLDIENYSVKKEIINYLSKSEKKPNIVGNKKVVSKLIEQLYKLIKIGKLQKDQLDYYRSIIKILSETKILEDKIITAFLDYMRVGESECCEIPELVDYLSIKPEKVLDQVIEGISDNHRCVRCTSMEILANIAGIALEYSEIDTILKLQSLVPELEQQMKSQPTSIQKHERMWLRYQATLALSALGAESAVEEGKEYINQNINSYGYDGKSRIRKKLEAIERNLKNYKKIAKKITKGKDNISMSLKKKESDVEPSEKKRSSSGNKKSKNLSKFKQNADFIEFEKRINNEKSSIKKEMIVSEFFKDLEESKDSHKNKKEILKLMNQNQEFKKIAEKLFKYRSMEERFGYDE